MLVSGFILEPQDWQAIALTLQLALLSTAILLVLATPLAWWLAYSQSRWCKMVQVLVALPLVLPPTVLGFYFLLFFGPKGWGGVLTQVLGWGLLPFSFAGLVLASILYSLPFAVLPLQQAFAALGRAPLEAAATLRAGPWNTFYTVALPLAWPGFVSAALLALLHTVGEFGVVLMMGGNIQGKTRVVSVHLYDYVEALQYAQAHRLALVLVGFSFLALLLLLKLSGRGQHQNNP